MALLQNTQAQQSTFSEKFGSTLNAGFGVGYYGYTTHTVPFFHIDYEFDVIQNFTIAPFIDFYNYTDNNYRQTVMPVGVKGSYYFDPLINAGPNWDFYLACSLGFAIRNTSWQPGYVGLENNTIGAAPLYLNFSIGTEYHLNKSLGALLEFSSSVSTIGIAIHKL